MILHDDEEAKKVVLFYIIYSFIYFPILLCLLIWSKGLDIVGKYNFQSILIMIVVAEVTKYFVTNWYYQRHDYSLSRKTDNSILANITRLFSRNKFKEGGKTVFLVMIMTGIYFMMAILYGAEIFTKHEESLMLSSLLSVLTVFPVCLNLGSHAFLPLLLGVKPSNKLEMLLAQNMYLTLGGAWLGAMVIPLDWDRPWQAWPIPCSLGAMAGFITSHVIMIQRLRDVPQRRHKS